MRTLPALAALGLGACTRAGESAPPDTEPVDTEHPDTDGADDAIVVVFTADTLGSTAATATDWCGHLRAIVGLYGLDMACLTGGVSASSWTGESHTRFLWPQHLDGELRENENPNCGSRSVLGTIAARLDAPYLFGSDNAVLGSRGKPVCPDGSTGFAQHTTSFEETGLALEGLAYVPEAQRPVHRSIDTLTADIAAGGPVVAFLNAFEVGGHQPRCWFDPDTEACEALWQIAVAEGLVEPDADRAETWLNGTFNSDFLYTVGYSSREAELRPLMWESTLEAIAWHRPALFDRRLVRILDAARDADRLGDLEIVIVGDHGENPCTPSTYDDRMNCAHEGETTEWTGIVPVLVTPAARGEAWKAAGLVGDAAHPWSMPNLAWGLLLDRGIDPPDDWPAPMPVGVANSWTCRTGGVNAPRYSGVHVEGDASYRCEDGHCSAWSWAVPTDLGYEPTELSVDALPASFDAYTGTPDAFHDWCGED